MESVSINDQVQQSTATDNNYNHCNNCFNKNTNNNHNNHINNRNYHNNTTNGNITIGFYGEPKAPAFLSKTVSFYSRLLLYPFSVEWSESQRSYILIRFSCLQKFCFSCFVFGSTIAFLYWVTTSIKEIEDLSKHGETITAGILILLCLLLSWISVITLVVTIWVRQEEIVAFLNILRNSVDVLHLPSAKVWLCPILFFFTSSITNLSSATGQITVDNGAKMMTEGIVCFLRKSFGIFSISFGNGVATVVSRWMIKSLRAFFKLVIFHGGCFCSMPHTLLLTLALGLRQVGKEVKARLESENVAVEEGIKIYEKVKEISRGANSVFGSIMLTHYLCNLTYAIQTPFLFSEMGQMLEDVNYLVWLFVSGLIWWTASEFHRLVHEAFRTWVQFNLVKEMCLDDRLRLQIISTMIEKDTLGLYCRYFTVTHQFLTTTCGAVITYGIFVLQVQFQQIEICRSASAEEMLQSH